MENAAKALTIAGGVLLAVIILAGLVYMFQRISLIPRQQEYTQEIEQLTEFNQQFEAYDKKLMYGVDVISCLNKVLDNNDKSQLYYDGEYDINIEIRLISNVEDRFEVWYYDNRTKKELKKTGSEGIGSVQEIFGDVTQSKKISEISAGTTVYNDNVIKSKLIGGKSYVLLGDGKEILKSLSLSTTDMEITKVNPNKEDSTNWTRARWRTAAYDFKSKRFYCVGIEYDSDGRVEKITFSEKQ